MTRQYFRPLPQTDAVRPETALPLAGSKRVWFDHVVALSRDAAPEILPAMALPDDALASLTAPRDRLCGLDMTQPQLMGVLNTTPDSFSDGGQHNVPDAAAAHARTMLDEGATILDIGGESTRPGAAFVPPEEEAARTVPVIETLRGAGIKAPISIDTRKAQVARAALAAGADLLNDVSAMTFEPEMADLARSAGAPICLMHAQGDPKTMQENPSYQNVLLDVFDFLEARIAVAEAAGIARSNIIVDPGIGFGKTQAHNLTLLQGLSLFHGLGCAILLGVSRKRFIGAIGAQPDPQRRAPGSVAIALGALVQGVQIIRAHDIEAHAQAFALWRAVQDQQQDA